MKVRHVLAAAFLLQLVYAGGVGALESSKKDLVAEASHFEAEDELPETSFFEADAASVQGKPGTVIRSEEFAGYKLPSSVHATRILYRSRSQLDHASVASAVLIVPTRGAPSGGWPLLVWAHGTTGVAPVCAPSRSKELGYYTDVLVKEGLTRGFAVLAVDYSGLGAGDHHEYLWKVANANDTVFAAQAARAADPQLAPIWVAIGHSQGGQATWGVAEKIATLHDPGYRGAVALAPAVDTETLINHVGDAVDNTFYPVFVAFGIKAVYPKFDIHAMLRPTGADAYQRLTTQGCWTLAHALFAPVKPGAVLDPKWTKTPQAQKMFASNQVGNRKIAGPLFVASGASDDSVPPPIIEARVKAQCSQGATVTYKSYPGDHGSMMKSSFADQMSWIMDRFQGQPAPSSCR